MAKEHDSAEITDGDTVDFSEVPFWSSARLGLAVLGFFGFICVYALRVNLSVAIMCMVNRTAITNSDNQISHSLSIPASLNSSLSTEEDVEERGRGEIDVCGWKGGTPETGNVTTSGSAVEGTLAWDKKTQGLVLGSFFWGYLLSQIPAGLLARKMGGKSCYGGAIVVASLLTFLTPLAASHSFQGLMVVRILLGIFLGVTFPAMHSLWGSWAPPLERTKLMAFTYAGAHVGNVITFPVAGFLCKYGFAGGWPSIFYVSGGVSLIWLAFWIFFTSDSPTQHGRISETEKRYILSSLKTTAQSDNTMSSVSKVPWKSIATSMPNYAIIVSNISSDWGLYTHITNIPTYISEVLNLDITSNGLVSALPFLGVCAVMNVAGWLADFLRKRQLLSTGATRKLLDASGKLAAGTLLVALGYIDCSQPTVAIALLVLGVSLAGFQYSGYMVNHVDIAPQYAGILLAISNSMAAVTGFISPVVVGVITEERQTRAEWQVVFYVAAAIYLFGALFYVIFASGNLEPWAVSDESDNDEIQVLPRRRTSMTC